MALTQIELDQIFRSRTFDDTLTPAASAETSADLGVVLDHVFSQLADIVGQTNWYDNPTHDLQDWANSSGVLQTGVDTANQVRTDFDNSSGVFAASAADAAQALANIGTLSGVVGVDIGNILGILGAASGDTALTYSSTVFNPQGGTVEAAIGTLDAAIAAVSGSVTTPTLTSAHLNGAGILDQATNATNTNVLIGLAGAGSAFNFQDATNTTSFMSIGSGVITALNFGFKEVTELGAGVTTDTAVTIPNSRSYTLDATGRNLDVYVNGQLQNIGGANDYTETTTTSTTFTRDLFAGETITWVIRG